MTGVIVVDGNDKLKRFGFSIHAAIDGFSRKLLWLKVSRSNKDPKLIASYFLETVKRLNCVPKIVRLDRGTENFHLADLQCLLRYDHTDSCRHIASLFGSSNHNQRIERFWGVLRNNILQVYMDIFKDLEESGLLDLSVQDEVECLIFCFNDMVTSDIEQQMLFWNSHRIRKSKAATLPAGVPEFLYTMPRHYGYEDQRQSLDMQVLQHDVCCSLFNISSENCDLAFQEWALTEMCHQQWVLPKSRDEALALYGNLLQLLRS